MKTLSALNGRSLLKELREVIDRKVVADFSALSSDHIMILDVSNTKIPFLWTESILKLLFVALDMICLTSGGRLSNSLRLTIFFFLSLVLLSLVPLSVTLLCVCVCVLVVGVVVFCVFCVFFS